MFGRKNKEDNNTEESRDGFVLGARQIFALADSEDLLLVGKAEGTVKKGDAVFLSNVGEDDGYLFVSTVLDIEKEGKEKVQEATDCVVALRVERASRYPVKPGTVVLSQDKTIKETQPAYIASLGDVFVAGKNLQLTDKELELLSITDCAEIWKLFVWYHTKMVQNESKEAVQENKARLNRLTRAMCKKIMEAEVIYCVYSKATGEPYLFSRTIPQNDGSSMCMCTPPELWILTKAYKDRLADSFPEDRFEIREIVNGPKKDGIRNFLGESFYLNGACGIQVLYEQLMLPADMLVIKPDYENVPEGKRPVMNPDLERWILLINQLGEPETEEQKIEYSAYYHLLAKELVKARLLMPVKVTGKIPNPDEAGNTVLKKDVSLRFPTAKGRDGRTVVRMYTDWKRLRSAMGEEWQGNIQTIDGIIEKFDCIINLKENENTGCYIGEEMYHNMKTIAEAGNRQTE